MFISLSLREHTYLAYERTLTNLLEYLNPASVHTHTKLIPPTRREEVNSDGPRPRLVLLADGPLERNEVHAVA